MRYKTNAQAWAEVTETVRWFERQQQRCREMFGQDNLVGLTKEQKDQFYKSY